MANPNDNDPDGFTAAQEMRILKMISSSVDPLQKQILSLKTRLDEKGTELDDANTKVKNLTKDNQLKTEEIERLTTANEEKDKKIGTLESQVYNLTREADRQSNQPQVCDATVQPESVDTADRKLSLSVPTRPATESTSPPPPTDSGETPKIKVNKEEGSLLNDPSRNCGRAAKVFQGPSTQPPPPKKSGETPNPAYVGTEGDSSPDESAPSPPSYERGTKAQEAEATSTSPKDLEANIPEPSTCNKKPWTWRQKMLFGGCAVLALGGFVAVLVVTWAPCCAALPVLAAKQITTAGVVCAVGGTGLAVRTWYN